MRPIEFHGHTMTYAKDQPEYQPLPAHKAMDPEGTVTTCWELSAWERVVLLFTGRLWLTQLSFHNALQPQLPRVTKPEHIK